MTVFIFGIVAIKAAESSYVREHQKLEADIQSLEASIDALEMDKQELVSFARLKNIAIENGLEYKTNGEVAMKENTSNDGADVE